MKLSQAVELYISLRDQKAAIEAEAKEKTAPLNDKMLILEAKLLKALDQTGSESVKTPFGTAYVSTRKSMSIADREIFLNHIRKTGNIDLLEARVSKAATEAYIDAEGTLPPGIDMRTERVVNIRRAS
jgi:hypothetical protein